MGIEKLETVEKRYQSLTEQEWVYQYAKNKENPLPVVLGTKGTWTVKGKPMIILVAFTMMDVLTLADLHLVSHHPVRVTKEKDLTYYAINIIDKKQVKKIIEEWR